MFCVLLTILACKDDAWVEGNFGQHSWVAMALNKVSRLHDFGFQLYIHVVNQYYC